MVQLLRQMLPKPQAKKKGKAQPAGSAAHKADAAVDDDGFAYSAVSFPYDVISSNKARESKKKLIASTLEEIGQYHQLIGQESLNLERLKKRKRSRRLQSRVKLDLDPDDHHPKKEKEGTGTRRS